MAKLPSTSPLGDNIRMSISGETMLQGSHAIWKKVEKLEFGQKHEKPRDF